MARLFIGLGLSPEMRRELSEWIVAASHDSYGFRWTATENLHLTLKFLGEVDNNQTDRLERAFTTVASQVKRFIFALGAPGCFPNWEGPRIIWVGVTQGTESLSSLAGLIEKVCIKNGFPGSDKPFRPHLTVARSGRAVPLQPVLPREFIFKSETKVDSFYLFESKLASDGPHYRIRAEYRLNN